MDIRWIRRMSLTSKPKICGYTRYVRRVVSSEEFKGMGNGLYYFTIDARHVIFDQND